MMRKWMAALALTVLLPGCAIRLGGPKPETYQVLALPVQSGETAAAATDLLRQSNVNIALLAGTVDSTWFHEVATAAGMELSGPGQTGSSSLAFLTRGLKLLGDTSLVLGVTGGGRIHLHDALYQIDKNRTLDLMLMRVDPHSTLRETVRSLLGYIATDVGGDAAIILGLEAPDPARADSVAVLMRAAFSNAWECTPEGKQGSTPPSLDLRLFYGPAVRMDCQHARLLSAPGNPINAELIVGRG